MCSPIALVSSDKQRHRLTSVCLGVALLLTAALARTAQADSADIINQLVEVQNAMLQAAQQHLDGDVASAVGTLDGALAILQSVQTGLEDPALADELGKKVKAAQRKAKVTQKKVAKAQVIIQDGRKKARLKLNKLRAAAKSAFKAASKLGRPLVAELNPRSAGFHKPGKVVQFQLYAVGCNEDPVLEVANAGLSSAIDLNSVGYDPNTGIISLMMGEEQGGGRVTVTACGQSSTVLLYNYGRNNTTQGLPKGFPANLPNGTYAISYFASGVISIPETSLGTVEHQDAKAFAEEIVATTRQVVNAVSSIQGCGASVGYSPFNGTSFRATWSITCSVGEVSVSATVVFKIRKL